MCLLNSLNYIHDSDCVFCQLRKQDYLQLTKSEETLKEGKKDRKKDREKERNRERSNKQTNKQTNKQKKKDRRTDRQTDRQNDSNPRIEEKTNYRKEKKSLRPFLVTPLGWINMYRVVFTLRVKPTFYSLFS